MSATQCNVWTPNENHVEGLLSYPRGIPAITLKSGKQLIPTEVDGVYYEESTQLISNERGLGKEIWLRPPL